MSIELGVLRVIHASHYSLYIMYNVFTKEISYCRRVIGQSYDEQKTFTTVYVANLNDYFFEIETNDQQWIMMRTKGKFVNHFQLVDIENKVVDVIVEPEQVQNSIGAKSFTTFALLHRYITLMFAKKYKNDLHTLMNQSIHSAVSLNVFDKKLNCMFKENFIDVNDRLTHLEGSISSFETIQEKLADLENSICRFIDSSSSETYDNNEIITLTHDNLLEQCVEYTKIYKPEQPSITDIIKHMLSSKQYVLCKSMFGKKLEHDELNKKLKLFAYQEALTHEELQELLFE